MRILDAEYRNVNAVLQAARAAEPHTQVWQIVYHLTSYLSKTAYGRDAEAPGESAVERARISGNRRGVAFFLTSLSMAPRRARHGRTDRAGRRGSTGLIIDPEPP